MATANSASASTKYNGRTTAHAIIATTVTQKAIPRFRTTLYTRCACGLSVGLLVKIIPFTASEHGHLIFISP